MPQQPFFSPPPESGAANPEAVFSFPTARFSLLTTRLLRVEFSPAGQFEDRPSQVFWYRRQPLPPTSISCDHRRLSLETRAFRLEYSDSPSGPGRDSLRITIKSNGASVYVDDPNPGRLPGTARTLDGADGPVRLQPGLISRSGWAQLDDTPSLVFNSRGWLEPRHARAGYRDLYFLICGQEYKSALQDYQLIAGKPPLLPRAFLGNWWSRYWEYSQADVEALVERFEQEGIPLSVFILDMDWHITKTGNRCSGWTGFSWNRSLFPDPPGLIEFLHINNLLTALNLHPAEGIHPHEERYPQAAAALEMDPAKRKPIRFDIADERFTRVYFDEILHPLEEMGVDFWWLDWQQGKKTSLKGLDPLWWLNHLHFYDLARGGKKRPIIFSRWGGPGSQRYPIGFSGDTVVSWETLAFQPYFTAAAANEAYGWWSHDIGGHMRGVEDKELYTRWVQFGALSPIFRLHSTKNALIDRRPWAFDAETLRLARAAMQIRHSLVPYLYTMARRNQLEGLPLITPLYYDYPNEDSAYLAGSQYLLGSELMAAPVVAPLEPNLNQSRQSLWFPPGEWYNFFSGEKFAGPGWKVCYTGLEDIPLFARSGAIVPLQAEPLQNGTANPQKLDLMVFPGGNGRFKLYEDDGVSQDYTLRGGAVTEFATSWKDSNLTIQIVPAYGDTELIPPKRIYRVLLRGVNRPDQVCAKFDGVSVEIDWSYDPAARTAVIGPVEIGMSQALTVEVNATINVDPEAILKKTLMRFLERARIETVTKWKISANLDKIIHDTAWLNEPDLKLSQSQLRGLIEIITGTGAAG